MGAGKSSLIAAILGEMKKLLGKVVVKVIKAQHIYDYLLISSVGCVEFLQNTHALLLKHEIETF